MDCIHEKLKRFTLSDRGRSRKNGPTGKANGDRILRRQASADVASRLGWR